jgi:hypothetical protein
MFCVARSGPHISFALDTVVFCPIWLPSFRLYVDRYGACMLFLFAGLIEFALVSNWIRLAQKYEDLASGHLQHSRRRSLATNLFKRRQSSREVDQESGVHTFSMIRACRHRHFFCLDQRWAWGCIVPKSIYTCTFLKWGFSNRYITHNSLPSLMWLCISQPARSHYLSLHDVLMSYSSAKQISCM